MKPNEPNEPNEPNVQLQMKKKKRKKERVGKALKRAINNQSHVKVFAMDGDGLKFKYVDMTNRTTELNQL